MKKILFFALLSILSLSVFAQTKPLFATFTTSKAIVNNYYFTLVSGTDDNKAEIDWGTGAVVETEVLKKDLSYGTDIPSAFAPAAVGGEVTIKIYGENIVGITCSTKSLTSVVFHSPASLLDLDLGGNQLGNFDFSGLTSLTSLTFSKNGATALDFSANSALRKLTINDNTLASLNISENINLEELTASACGITNIDLTSNKKLTALLLSNNPLENPLAVILSLPAATMNSITMLGCGITAVDMTPFVELTSINFNNNPIESIDLTQCTKLKILYLSGSTVPNSITSLDLSKCTSLTTINLQGTATVPQRLSSLKLPAPSIAAGNVTLNVGYNDLESIDVSGLSTLKTFTLAGNKFKMSALPNKTASITSYTYQPQKPMVLPTTLDAGATLDLSSEDNLLGMLAADPSPVRQITAYEWKKADNKVLVAGTDYTVVEAGKFSFPETLIGESVYCEMTTAAFPNFKAANIFKTTAVKIGTSASVDQDQLKSVRAIAIEGGLMITNLKTNSLVEVLSVEGRQVQSFIASGSATVSLQRGVYVIRTNGKLLKAAVK